MSGPLLRLRLKDEAHTSFACIPKSFDITQRNCFSAELEGVLGRYVEEARDDLQSWSNDALPKPLPRSSSPELRRMEAERGMILPALSPIWM